MHALLAILSVVTIAFGDGGLRVGTDTLVKAKVDGAAYDPALELVWFTSKGTLQVLDLRAPKSKPVVIVKKLPAVGFWIHGTSEAQFNTSYTQAYVNLDLTGKKPKLSAQEGAYAPVDQAATDKLKKKIAKAKIVGAKWLAKLGKRALSAVTLPTAAPQGNVKLPEGMCHADDPAECGAALSFGTTAYQLVISEMSCGDACYMACVLYDPKAKKFADPDADQSGWGATAESGPCDGYWFAADAASYVQGTRTCTLDKGVRCTDDPAWTFVGIR